MKQSTIGIVLVCAALTSCSTFRLNQRLAFWEGARTAELKPGTSFDDARSFVRAQGIELSCSPPDADGQACQVTEWNVGRMLIMEYSLLINLHFSSQRTIDDLQIVQLGTGP